MGAQYRRNKNTKPPKWKRRKEKTLAAYIKMRFIFNRIKKECFEIKLNARISDDVYCRRISSPISFVGFYNVRM